MRLLRYGKLDASVNQERSPERKASWEAADLVKQIYPEISETLFLAAMNGVLQVLMKLEDEGRVVNDPSTGRWKWNPGRSAL